MIGAPQCQDPEGKTRLESKKDVDYINHGEEEEMKVYGYIRSQSRTVTTWLGTVLTLGLLRLLFHWKPHWGLLATHVCCDLGDADKILFKENFQGKFNKYYIKVVKHLSIQNTSSSPIQYAMENVQTVCVQLSNGTIKEVEKLKAVWVKKLCYVWDEDTRSYARLCGLDKGVSHARLHEYRGYSEQEQSVRRVIYGKNEISVPLQSILTLLLLEVLTPFYIFQIFTLIVWICEFYIYYTAAIIIMSVFGVASSILQTWKNQHSLHAKVHSRAVVQLWRGGEESISTLEVSATLLVPGDIIIIPPQGCQLHCDAVILDGTCIVNESMLTGESVPVTKTSLPLGSTVCYDTNEDAIHTLFCGTKVIQTRPGGGLGLVRAVVIRTGYLTTKGALVRSILYPPPADFRFEQDVNRFLGVLGVIAILGVIYTIVSKAARYIPAGDIALKALDIITIVVPPALPATMTMGKLYGQNRLQKARIFCINSRIINVAGSLDCVCFDKTGTLTEDGLDMWGVVPAEDGNFQHPFRDGATFGVQDSPLVVGMASCHSITLIDDQITGDPLDVKMFMFTGWKLTEPSLAHASKFDVMVPTVVYSGATEIGIIQQYQFSSTLQRMSVVTRALGSQQSVVFCKGSPEMIASLSRSDTVPADLEETLWQYTSQGYRVVALGWRNMDEPISLTMQHLTRDSVECDLNFVGLIILENRLKPQSAPIIQQLNGASIRTIMVTGDNVQTAVSVARDCGIVAPDQHILNVTVLPGPNNSSPKIVFSSCSAPITRTTRNINLDLGISNAAFQPDGVEDGEIEKSSSLYTLALTGASWAAINENASELLPRILVRGAVFARMTSDQKQQLVTALKDLGYCVAMCGDGANDCGALKAAHVGISLSEAESSVASPFTSREPNISCVPHVVREGRAALITAFGIFKYMVAYSLSEFVSVAILYTIDSNLTDFQFLFIDICLIVHFALFFGKTSAYSGTLVKETPTSLFSLTPMSSLVLQMLIVVLIQVLSFELVQTFSWFTPYHYIKKYYKCFENYAVFTVSIFQYISLVIVFSQGSPYRKSILSNLFLMTSLVIMTVICIYITLSPADWLQHFLELQLPPSFNFRIVVLCLAVVHFVLALLLEKFVVQYIIFNKLRYACHNTEQSQKRYLRVEQELLMTYGWPPLTSELPKKQLNMVTKF